MKDYCSETMIDLAPEYLNIVREVFRNHLPHAQVWAFGSRVTWTAKEFSDLDLAIINNDLIPADVMGQIAEELSESNIPIKIDILEWQCISEEFRKEITKQHYSIYKYRLDEIGKIVTGKTPLTKYSHNFGNAVPFITPRDMADSRYIIETERSLSLQGSESVKNAIIPENSIVVSCIGSDMGKVAIARRKSVTNQQINSLIVNEKNDFLYVYYDLCTRKDELKGIASGSALPILNKSAFEKIEIDLPPLDTQKEIAHILGTLDDKKELNRKMNKTLEEIAQALFKHWFIDFEFPNEEGKPYKSSGGEMIESELGVIPKGWRVVKLSDEFEITMGQSPPGDTYNLTGNGLPFFQGNADFGLRYPKNRVYCTNPKRLAQAGDTLISVRAPVGDINMAYERCCIGRGLSAIRHKSKSVSYTYYALHTLKDKFSDFDKEGTVFGCINKDDFRSMSWLKVQLDEIELFDLLINSYDKKIRTSNTEETLLQDQMQTLLNMLLK